LGQLTVKISWS